MYDPSIEPEGSREVLVTPSLAHVLLTRWSYPKNRTKSQSAIRRYAALMRANRWKLSSLDFFRNAEDDAVYLCNGHRRLRAVIQAERAVRFRACMGRLPTFEHIHEQYLTYDDPNSIRRLSEVVGGTSLEAVGPSFVTKLRAAVALILDDFGTPSPALRKMPMGVFAEQIELLTEWIPALDLYRSFLSGSGGKEALWRGMIAAPAMAVALVTFRDDQEEAEEFWRRIAGDDGLEKGSPEWLANRYIREQGFNKGITPAYRSRYVAGCWNAMKEGRQAFKMYPNPSQPIKILGTRYGSPSSLG